VSTNTSLRVLFGVDLLASRLSPLNFRGGVPQIHTTLQPPSTRSTSQAALTGRRQLVSRQRAYQPSNQELSPWYSVVRVSGMLSPPDEFTGAGGAGVKGDLAVPASNALQSTRHFCAVRLCTETRAPAPQQQQQQRKQQRKQQKKKPETVQREENEQEQSQHTTRKTTNARARAQQRRSWPDSFARVARVLALQGQAFFRRLLTLNHGCWRTAPMP
jgi:hypothetical protein